MNDSELMTGAERCVVRIAELVAKSAERNDSESSELAADFAEALCVLENYVRSELARRSGS